VERMEGLMKSLDELQIEKKKIIHQDEQLEKVFVCLISGTVNLLYHLYH